MYDMPSRPRQPAAVKAVAAHLTKALAANVVASAPQMRRFRAVVTRHISQTAVVEFDAAEGVDRYALANDLAAQVPEDAWVSADPSTGYVDQIQPLDA